MEQHDNMTLNDFTGSPGAGDYDFSAVQAFLENRDYEHLDQEAVEYNLEANPVSWTNGPSADKGSVDYQSGTDDAFERANGDIMENGDHDTVDDDLFGGDYDLDESTAGDEEAPGAPSLPVEEQPSLNPYALALPPAVSQQPVEPFRDPASSGDAVDADGVAAPQNPGFPDFAFDFNADPSNPGFDVNDLLPLEEELLPKSDPELLVFAAQNASRTVNQSGAEFGVQKPELTLPEDSAAQQAVVDNAEAVITMTDEELAKLLEADLAKLLPTHDDQVVDNCHANSRPRANPMADRQPIPATLPYIQNCETNPGVMPDNVFLQSHKATVDARLPLSNYPPTHLSAGTNVGQSNFSPVARPDIPAPSYNRRRSRDEFQNDGYSAPQPSQPFAKKPRGPNIDLPTLNLPQQSFGGNASSYQPGGPVTDPLRFPPQQAAEAQRPVGNQHQQAFVGQGVNVPQRPPVQPPVPPAVLPPAIHDGYQPLPAQDRNWGVGVRGRHIFQYTDKGEWVYGQVYTADQLKDFICGENRDGLAPSRSRLTIWIQSTLNGHKNRYPQAVKCRWKDCPVKHRTITQGQYRVCFDEHSDTSGRTTDPFHNTGYMHLYCFEQCAPLVSLIKNPPGMVRVAPDDRRFFNAKENGNPMQLGGSFAAHGRHFIDLYNTWVEATWPKWQNKQMSSRDTLYYALADLHLRMFSNRQTTVAHLREHMGDLRHMQELRDQKDHSRLKRDRDDDDDGEEDERPRQKVKTQNLGQPQPAAPMPSQENLQNGYETSAYGQEPNQPANNGPSQRYGQPQPGPPINYQQHPRSEYGDYTHADGPSQPAHNSPRHDGYDQTRPPAPHSSYKRPRADDDDGTYEFEQRDEYGTGFEPHTPKRVKVSIPSAPHRPHNSRYGRQNQANIPGTRFHPNPQRPVNLPTPDNPFTIDPRLEINPHLLNPSLNPDQPPDPAPYYPFAPPVYNPHPSSDPFQSDADLTALPNQNSHLLVPDSNPSSSYPDPMALPGPNNHFLAPEPRLSPQPAHTPTRYSDPSDNDIETWRRGPSAGLLPPPPSPGSHPSPLPISVDGNWRWGL